MMALAATLNVPAVAAWLMIARTRYRTGEAATIAPEDIGDDGWTISAGKAKWGKEHHYYLDEAGLAVARLAAQWHGNPVYKQIDIRALHNHLAVACGLKPSTPRSLRRAAVTHVTGAEVCSSPAGISATPILSSLWPTWDRSIHQTCKKGPRLCASCSLERLLTHERRT